MRSIYVLAYVHLYLRVKNNQLLLERMVASFIKDIFKINLFKSLGKGTKKNKGTGNTWLIFSFLKIAKIWIGWCKHFKFSASGYRSI